VTPIREPEPMPVRASSDYEPAEPKRAQANAPDAGDIAQEALGFDSPFPEDELDTPAFLRKRTTGSEEADTPSFMRRGSRE